MRTNNKRGISLIVLVITIIVMIILAAAIILSVSNSGIMSKANKAKQDSDAANLKEYVNVLQAEWELMDADEKSNTGVTSSIAYVNKKLKDKYPDAALSADGKVYSGLNKNARDVIVGGIKIGDTVTGYTLDSSKSSTTTSGKENTATTSSSGYQETNNQSQSVSQIAFTTWRYVGISNNGEIMIIPDMPTSGTTGTMKLSGKGGYLNGVEELNKVCNALYSTNKGTARSINMDDVEELLNYTGPKGCYASNYSNFYSQEALTIRKIIDTKGMPDLTAKKTPSGDIYEYKSDGYGISQTDKNISASDTVKSIIFSGGAYWLASTCSTARFSVSRDTHIACFSMRCVLGDSGVTSCDMMTSSSPVSGSGFKVRPIVQINSDVSVSYSNGTLTLN